jgi:hypothetical protein
MRRGGNPFGVVVNRIVLTADIEAGSTDLQQIAKSIVSAMDTWWDTLRTWLEVVTGQHLTRIGHEGITVLGNTSPIWQVREDGTDVTVFPKPFRATVGHGLVNAVTAEVLRGCLSAAAEDSSPLAWTLVRDARSLHEAGQYRRAVIDAATAAELAATAILDTRLEDVEEEVRGALLAAHRMLARRAGC